MSDNRKKSGRTWAALWVILGLGLVLRLVLLIHFQGEPLHIVDEQQYNDIAVTLARTGNFATPSGELTSIRPPMYIWLVAGVYRALGTENPELVFTVVRAIQAGLALLTAVLVFGLGRRLFGGDRAGLAAAGLFCFYPSLTALNFMILTETLFIFWLTAAVYLAVCFLDRGEQAGLDPGLSSGSGLGSGLSSSVGMGWGRLVGLSVLCGFCLGCGALTRSILWLAVPCLSLYLFMFLPGGGWSKRFACAGLVFLSAALVILPWAVRNTQLQKTITVVDCMSGRNLMMGNYEYTPLYRSWDAVSMPQPYDWVTVLRGYTHPFNALTQGQKDKIASRYAKEYIFTHPGQTAKRCGVKFLCFWQLERSLASALWSGWYGATPAVAGIVTVIVWGWYVLVFVSGTAGAIMWGADESGWRNWRVGVLFLCVISLFWGVHALVFAHSRYHLPLIFVFCLFAGYYWNRFWSDWKAGSLARSSALVLSTGWALAFAAPFGVFWLLEIKWMLSE